MLPRTMCGLTLVAAFLTGCDRTTQDEGTGARRSQSSSKPAESFHGATAKRKTSDTAEVDATDLSGLCVLAALPTPPNVSSSRWQNLGSATVGGTP